LQLLNIAEGTPIPSLLKEFSISMNILGEGICGVLRGVDLTIGTEDFLIERGIHFQPTDSVDPSHFERTLFVAIDADVIAHFKVILARLDQVKLIEQSKESDKLLTWFMSGSEETSSAPSLSTLIVHGEGDVHQRTDLRFTGNYSVFWRKFFVSKFDRYFV